MILKALADYYNQLLRKELVPAPGWSKANISFRLEINAEGELINIVRLKQEVERGNKQIEVPTSMQVPEQVKKSVGIVSNFLCENSSYLLGVDLKGKPDRSIQCFEACRDLHKSILGNVNSEAAQAVVLFFDKWQPEEAPNHRVLQNDLEEIMTNSNLVLYYKDSYIHECREIRNAWLNYKRQKSDNMVMLCPIEGENLPAARLHPSIKGVRGAQSAGASLVSYNAPAYESYGKKQSFNSSISEQAAFAYTTALNYMLNQSNYKRQLGNTTILYWAEDGEELYQEIIDWSFFGEKSAESTQEELDGIVSYLIDGKRVDQNDIVIDPDKRFYILGIDPNAARLSVRFFIQNSFGNLLNNVKTHYERLKIIKPNYEKIERLSIWYLLQETLNPKSKDKNPSPLMNGAVMRSILMNTPYPAALINNVMIRIRAEKNINYRKAAIIKAYWLLNGKEKNKEVLSVYVNEESKNIPYVLGRLFSVFETIQEAANPGINSTIKDRYFTSASSTPAIIFPVLQRLSMNHLKKLNRDKQGMRIYYEKMLGDLMGKIQMTEEPIPKRLGLEEQGIFNLGYYHQNQERYTKKQEDK